jgi:7SK snRNA methylphosphate capping enzyme
LCYTCVTQGGLFILEPQPWKSYRQAFRKQEMPLEVKQNLHQLTIRPHQFAEELTTNVRTIRRF